MNQSENEKKLIAPNIRHIDWLASLAKTVLALLAIYYSWNIALHPGSWSLIDNTNLAIHEFGHLLFSYAGQFWYMAGGTIVQLLIPLLLAFHFLWRRDNYAASIMGLWLGESLINVYVYVRDAIKMELPLLGGEGTIHDWNWLLTDLKLINHTELIAQLLWWLAITIIFISSITALLTAWRQDTNRDEF